MKVSRIHLKPDGKGPDARERLIEFCLTQDPKKQYLAIGWSSVYPDGDDREKAQRLSDYQGYYSTVTSDLRRRRKRVNTALNIFRDAAVGDLFWTRDLDGFYWICRAIGRAQSLYEANIPIRVGLDLDFGAVLPVEAYRYGTQVPGAVKASFNRPKGGTAERLDSKPLIPEFSKYVFNQRAGRREYSLEGNAKLARKSEENIITNLPDLDLEELVLSYIQIRYNYYLLSNSIANKSTTVKIEGEFLSRDPARPGKAVVQVKGPGRDKVLAADSFETFIKDGYTVFLYAPLCDPGGYTKEVEIITVDQLTQFYHKYKSILPRSVTQWENIFQAAGA